MPRKVKTVPSLADVLVSLAEPRGRKLITFEYGRRNQSLYHVVGLRRVDDPGVIDVLMRTSRCAIPEVMRLDYNRSEACLLAETDGQWPDAPEVVGRRKPARPRDHYDRFAAIASILGDTDERLYLSGNNVPDSIRIDVATFEAGRRDGDLTATMLGEVSGGRSHICLHLDFAKQAAVLNEVRVPELAPA